MIRLCNELMAVPFGPPWSLPLQVQGADLHGSLYPLPWACSARRFVHGVYWRVFPQRGSGVDRSLVGSLGFKIQYLLAIYYLYIGRV